MSIASEIQALQTDKDNIATAISNKGVTVPSGSGFDSFAGLINDIPSGGIGKIEYLEGTVIPASDTNYIEIEVPQDVDMQNITQYEIVEETRPATENILANSVIYIGVSSGLYWYETHPVYYFNNYIGYYYKTNGSTAKSRFAQNGGFNWTSTALWCSSHKVHFQMLGDTYFFRANIPYKYRICYKQ